VVALQAVIVTYDGWYSAIYFMEEDRDPLTPDFSLAMAFALKLPRVVVARSHCIGMTRTLLLPGQSPLFAETLTAG